MKKALCMLCAALVSRITPPRPVRVHPATSAVQDIVLNVSKTTGCGPAGKTVPCAKFLRINLQKGIYEYNY